MYDVKRGSRSRCLLIWLAATAVAVGLVAWAAPDLGGRPRLAPFDAWLTWLCAVATALCAAWGWLVTSVVVLEALSGPSRRTPAPGVPAWARRLVLAVCGAAVLASAAPAMADDRPNDRLSVLEGLPLPDRAEGRSFTELVVQTMAPRQQHLVRPGDSLWSIAEARLGDPTYWPRVYALNRDLVGPDPDLIRPGQLLRLPELHGKEIR
jgi:hypothetical protein